MALTLYRKAAGIEGSINLDGAPPTASKQELDALRKEPNAPGRSFEKARKALDEERLKSSQETERLLQQKLKAAAAGNTDEMRRLESLLKDRETELEKRRQQVAQFESANEDYKARLTRLEGEGASLRQDLDAARRQLAQSQHEIDEKKASRPRRSASWTRCNRKSHGRKMPGAGRSESDQGARSRAREKQIGVRSTKQEIARLESDVGSYRTRSPSSR